MDGVRVESGIGLANLIFANILVFMLPLISIWDRVFLYVDQVRMFSNIDEDCHKWMTIQVQLRLYKCYKSGVAKK